MPRPLALTVLGSLQFAAFGLAVVMLLGESTLDGELSAGDVAAGVGVALVGALVVGCTWYGGPVAWWLEIVLAIGGIGVGALLAAADDPPVPGAPVAAAGVLWLAVVLLPPSRAWFLRPQE